MSSYANSLYTFFTGEISKALSGDALEYTEVVESGYGRIAEGKTLRINDAVRMESVLSGTGTICNFNALMMVELYSKPETQAIEDKIAAREEVSRMADAASALLQARFESVTGTRLGDVYREDDWRGASGASLPASYLRFTLNPRKR